MPSVWKAWSRRRGILYSRAVVLRWCPELPCAAGLLCLVEALREALCGALILVRAYSG